MNLNFFEQFHDRYTKACQLNSFVMINANAADSNVRNSLGLYIYIQYDTLLQLAFPFHVKAHVHVYVYDGQSMFITG